VRWTNSREQQPAEMKNHMACMDRFVWVSEVVCAAFAEVMTGTRRLLVTCK
jgi:hypothetical protein